MTTYTAHGDRKMIERPSPHYQWPVVDETLHHAIRVQTERSLSDRDASGIIGEFESAFAQFTGSPFAVSFASGTSAIHAMSRVAGLKPGDAILAPAYTFLATASPFAFEGVEVIFVDADDYGNVDAEALAARWQDHVRAVIVTHMWGNPCDMPAIASFCRTRGLFLFEDCSHAHFASYAGQHVGTVADLAVYSTNQKAITTGEGGVLTMSDRRLRDKALLFGHYNKRCEREIDPSAEYYAFAYTGMGLKHRMHPLGAAIGVHQLGLADNIERRRRGVLDRFVTGLADNPVVKPVVVPAELGRHGLYVVPLHFQRESATVNRDEFVELCHAAGATELDVPGSTRDISTEPLFARRDPHAAYHANSGAITPMPGVTAFDGAFLKLPIWGYDGDAEIIEEYIAVLTKVSEAVAV